MSNSATHNEHVNQPKVTTTKRTVFSALQIVEALNTVYPDVKINMETVHARAAHEMGSPVTDLEFTWEDK